MYIFINILFIAAVVTFITSISFLWKSAKMIRNGNKNSDEDVKKWDKRGIITLLVSVSIFIMSYLLSLIA
jgi:O-antigen/teichoic acid export membrane protein